MTVAVLTVLAFVHTATAKPAHKKASRPKMNLEGPAEYIDRVGHADGSIPQTRKVMEDTVWIADWSFDIGTECTDVGWEAVDLS